MTERTTPVTVLAIIPNPEDQSSLREIFCHCKWSLHFIEVRRHVRILIDELAVGVVVSECRLPDGDWKDVLQELQRRPLAPPLIVASRLADERLWAEVLSLGGYDVLTTPFRPDEVIHSVSLAWRHWRDERHLHSSKPPVSSSAAVARRSGA